MFIEHLSNTLEFYLEESYPSYIERIVVNCIEEAGYSLKEALNNNDIVNEIRTAISSSLHKFDLNTDKCIEAQIKLWNGYYTLSRAAKYARDDKDREKTAEEIAEESDGEKALSDFLQNWSAEQ